MTDKKYVVLMLSEKQKERLSSLCCEVTDLLTNSCEDESEVAFCLRVLMESFEEAEDCIIPFKNRYTEPVFNYQEKGLENKDE